METKPEDFLYKFSSLGAVLPSCHPVLLHALWSGVSCQLLPASPSVPGKGKWSEKCGFCLKARAHRSMVQNHN